MTELADPHTEHGHGLAEDLARLRALDRRRALGLFGAASGFALLGGCGGEGTSSASSTAGTATPTPTSSATATPTPTSTATSSGSCTVYAKETNGPYPADGTNQSSGTTSNVLTIAAFQRSDIRSSVLGSSSVAAGVKLELTLTLVDANNSCQPLAGYAIYVWHCNAKGQYSLYNLPAEDYLRGIQVTDANGQVTFATIVPGCYAGRYPHIHFEVFSSLAKAASASYAVLISQLTVPSAVCSTVYADTTTYGSSANNFANVSINSDNVFGDNTTAQKAAMTLAMSGSASAGYTATATVAIATRRAHHRLQYSLSQSPERCGALKASGRTANAATRAGESVLVVDDDSALRELIGGFLAGHGYRVIEAGDVPAMRSVLAREAPDLVVLALMMPGEDGLAALRTMPAGHPPVIMLSALGEETDRIVGLELGADDYLAKPCNPRELLARIRAVLRRGDATGQEPDAIRFAGGGSTCACGNCAPPTAARWS